MQKWKFWLGIGLMSFSSVAFAQQKETNEQIRSLHYTADAGDFLLKKGKNRFNRALYGDNRASRVEAGDLPEFALYLPGMGGNLQFVLQRGKERKKLNDADHIETRYRAGAMVYTIKDKLIGSGELTLYLLAQAEEEGLVLKISGRNVAKDAGLYAIYGGASGTRFSRNGDIGADPESGFYLLPEYASKNKIHIQGNAFDLQYLGRKEEEQHTQGSFSDGAIVKLSNATALDNLAQLPNADPNGSPILYGYFANLNTSHWLEISKGKLAKEKSTAELTNVFDKAEAKRQTLLSRVQLQTPDPYLNNLAGALVTAADGIWEFPTYLHGAVAWRMPLNAWRGAYIADVLGWHDRARAHFDAYSNSQVTEPAQGPVVMDTALHLARHLEEIGTAMFSSGYISRNPNNNKIAHHYDMNLVFIDQLLTHFDHTGDKAYIAKMWPTLERHLAWEKRNFDRDRDALYDAYCAIWASDGLQYSGGGVTHTTAYNLRSNRMAAKLASIIGKNPEPYQKEAEAIEKALYSRLWLKDKGHFAEFQDALGNKLLHDSPGLWTIYHAADARFMNTFEHYQQTQYVHNHIPRIPIQVDGFDDHNLHTLSITNWQPYTWSINNIALAENLHAALAFWQAGRQEDAYELWRSNLLESMYFGKSPGNFHQLSHYDAFRGELYRDFADPIAMAARTLVEGLFGVQPHLLDAEISIRPGFPIEWKEASLALPQWTYQYSKSSNELKLHFKHNYDIETKLKLEIPSSFLHVQSVKVNGQQVDWKYKDDAVNQPILLISTPKGKDFQVSITGNGLWELPQETNFQIALKDTWTIPLQAQQEIAEIKDPQQLIKNQQGKLITFNPKVRKGTFFVRTNADQTNVWRAVNVDLIQPIQQEWSKQGDDYVLKLKNRSTSSQELKVTLGTWNEQLDLGANQSKDLKLPLEELTRGTNEIELSLGDYSWKTHLTDWDLPAQGNVIVWDMGRHYNARAQEIFQQKYLSPRPEGPTLQLPWQGIGNWCYPLTTANIDDTGLMAARTESKLAVLDIPFLIANDQKNILFTSQWDNYPTQASFPVSIKAKKAYVLLAGSTNPMQSQMDNAVLSVQYTDGTSDSLVLKNPTNYWPIEQDYLDDDKAFDLPDDEIPYRIKLKDAKVFKAGTLAEYGSIKGFSTRAIEGGAATLLDLPLNPDKEVSSVQLRAHTNDVVVGLMAISFLQ
ncbi:DUF4450 domain-containing protein [Sphingobacterium hotanense]|uniref:DUF4450 domain-containing protein n=1 Tax=Sphingobacterium hotanense TaxID=649196 RepID=UPI0011F11744|nr:DUF4450 domain-containing protein [Sphingobacterium hotanense]